MSLSLLLFPFMGNSFCSLKDFYLFIFSSLTEFCCYYLYMFEIAGDDREFNSYVCNNSQRKLNYKIIKLHKCSY